MRIPKKYASFGEIDKDLKILKLQQEVDMESLKYRYESTKKSLYPTKLMGGFGGILQKIFITLVAKRILKKIT
jgi:hypothetical protein